MKQKDIALIIVIAAISGVISFVVSDSFFGKPSAHQQHAEVVSQIDPQFNLPDSTYFNSNAIDPTQLFQLGNTNNPNPFSGSQ